MYLVAIAWIYVTLMMALAEATNPTGSILGAVITFILYGILPLSILMYILGTPQRKRRLREKEVLQNAAHTENPPSTPQPALKSKGQ